MDYKHIPVLLREVVEILNPQPGQTYIDCTLGGASYTSALAKEVGQKGRVIAIDADEMAIKNAESIIKNNNFQNVILVHNNFRNLADIAEEYSLEGVDGIVFDLGLSSAQLDDESRGFSFQGDRPLDMAFGAGEVISTQKIINSSPLSELTRIFREFGEEFQAYRLAKEIITVRKRKPIKTTKELVDIILKITPVRFSKSKIHPATRVFQALRLATNDEFASLKEALEATPKILKVGGRLAVVTFHSGEDRIVKQWLKQESLDCLCPPQAPVCVCGHKALFKPIIRKPLMVSEEELKANPRSRSAKLRVAEKIFSF
ncbi:MAG: 16S rRNA (cytosine(1402)-N(4))-methyltransferase RsmH [Patescibacteria group bacterium]|nr:16S rRNA (cytosine(1402)-N(4))-methyltransferase RsmH [Patescibacteria group bacterium]